jgi:4-hydroxy-4-methyl-2-oxoglutarate aldolase
METDMKVEATNTDADCFARLREFDTPTVLNVIELFEVRPREAGYIGGEIRALFPEMPPAVGYATTATFTSARPAARGDVYSSLADQVERFLAEVPAPRIVVFQDIDPRPAGATFGEVMCTVYKAFGCAGLITSGGARDLEQVRRLGFPCWASSVIASHANCRILEVNVPVTAGGCEIRPGDVIHADQNGVALIPPRLVAEVALGCRLLAEAENEVLSYVSSGKPTVEGLRAAHRRCRELFATIPERVRGMMGE